MSQSQLCVLTLFAKIKFSRKIPNLKYSSFFTTECGDGKCEDLEGENCDVCPADCGNCPLEAWQLALIGVGVALVLGAAIGVLIVRQIVYTPTSQ